MEDAVPTPLDLCENLRTSVSIAFLCMHVGYAMLPNPAICLEM